MKKFYYYVNPSVRKKLSRSKYDFFKEATKLLPILSVKCAESTVRNCVTALNSFSAFCSGKMPFSFMDANLLQAFEHYLLHKAPAPVKPSTAAEYMRSLRSLYNRLVALLHLRNGHPFVRVSTGVGTSVKHALSQTEMSHVMQAAAAYNSQSPSDQLQAHLVRFSFLACGMPYIDMAYLQWNHVNWQDRTLTYYRQKTRVKIELALTPQLISILKHYEASGRCRGIGQTTETQKYVFPIITTTDASLAFRQYHNGLALYNRFLHRLGRQNGVRGRLTSYVIRHTWATLAHNDYKIELSTISRALGHKSEQTTLRYISQIDACEVFKAQRTMERRLMR